MADKNRQVRIKDSEGSIWHGLFVIKGNDLHCELSFLFLTELQHSDPPKWSSYEEWRFKYATPLVELYGGRVYWTHVNKYFIYFFAKVGFHSKLYQYPLLKFLDILDKLSNLHYTYGCIPSRSSICHVND